MATYAIGDVQGCWDNLRALLARIAPGPGDRLWLTGDLVNRGPRSLEVLRWARDQGDRLVAVLGNHDLHLISCARGIRKPRRSDTFHDLLEAPDRDELVAWLARRPLLHREGDWMMVHAGLLPDWSAADAEHLAREVEATGLSDRLLGSWRDAPRRWRDDLDAGDRHALAVSVFATIRCVDRAGAVDRDFDGPPQEAPPGLVPWFDHPARRTRGEVKIACGHWAALGLLVRPDLAALDSGCVWGGVLTALRLDDGALFQVPGYSGS
jgi:bis(5'-nucleosyl)-tetraphosphatase (symmetrical)